MSTVNPNDKDDPGEPLSGTEPLLSFFSTAAKPRDRFRIGTEHEKFGFLRVPGAEVQPPLPYEGPRSIESIFQAILDDVGEQKTGAWTPALDRGRIIALFKGDASITLEPGGQFELSGAPFHTVHETCAEVNSHLKLLRRVCLPLDVGFIGLGFHPTASFDELPLVPKARYDIMQRYMPLVGKRGLDMMKRTATVQANFDWEDEADMVATFQTALVIAPLAAALFANSPFVDGKPSGHVSERQAVWDDTDPDRSGFPSLILERDFSYERYLDWVLDVPMYFVRRDGIHHDVAGASFRSFLHEGLIIDGETVRATLRDFSDHLTTIFPEVRMKRVIEVRSADCGPWSRVCALPALYKGVLYDVESRAKAYALMDSPTSAELVALRADVAVNGYRATYRGRTVLSLCEELLELSRAGLARFGAKNWRGQDESRFLEPLNDSVGRGLTFGEMLLEKYRGPWKESLASLWDEVEFWPDRDLEALGEGASP